LVSQAYFFRTLFELSDRGKVRAALTDEMEKRSAIVVKLKMLVNADEKVLGAGNLNKTLSLDILYKISSENRAKYDLDKEFVTFMIKLFNQQQIRGEEIHGYIQEFAIILLPVILFREKTNSMLSF